jgi:hypothetical protein
MDPIEAAYNRMKKILFEPFDLSKWLVLGFCCFLAQLGEGGGGGGGGGFDSFSGGGGSEAIQWIKANLALILTIIGIVVILIIVVGIVLTWLSSRGRFMFLDGVIHNRALVAEPWSQFRTLANSLFLFRVVFGVVGLFIMLLIVGGAVLIALPDIRAERFGPMAFTALGVGGSLFVLSAIALGLIGAVVKDFIVPIMWKRNVRTIEAFGVLRNELLPGQVVAFVVFYIMRFVLGIAIGIIVLLGTCLTCCLAALPYISSVVFLPLWVFVRCYPICFLEQFGEDWRFFEDQGHQGFDPSLAPQGPEGDWPASDDEPSV